MTRESYRSGKLLRERGFTLRTPPFAFASFDAAGDGDDFYALSVTYREEWQFGEPTDAEFAVEKLHRIQLARRLPQSNEFVDNMAVLLRLATHLAQLRDAGRIAEYVFTIETNGVGHGYASALRSKLGPRRVIGIFTTGGMDAKPVVEDRTTMPRLAALDLLRMLVEMHYVRAAKDAVGIDDLAQELQTFVWRGKNRPEAMQGHHDDLVMALAMNIWTAEKLVPPMLKQHIIQAPRRVA